MDLLNLAGDERLDLGDLTFATNEVPAGLVNELTGRFLVAPGGSAIVTGFRPSGSGQGPVQVGDSGTPNVALVGQRLGGVITQGVLTVSGPATQQITVSGLPANTYGIFIRFNRLPGQSQTRKFWAKAAPGQEYSQLQSTRLVATWEARVEVSSPSPEWVRIGQVVITSAGSGQGSTISVTDQRVLYFEGPAADGYAPTWGSAADRSADRNAANVGNLQRQLDALRQCIVDIKGRGLATWYQPNISGLQVGSGYGLSATPFANTICIGDDKFNLNLNTGTIGGPLPGIAFDGGNDYLAFNRSTGGLFRQRGANQLLRSDNQGILDVGPPAGLSQGMVCANHGAISGIYSLAGVTTGSSVPASLGLISKTATTAIIELGTGFGQNIYGRIRASWSSGPKVEFFSIDYPFLQAFASSGNSSAQVNVQGDSFTMSSTRVVTNTPITVGSRVAAAGGTVFAAGYVSISNFNPAQLSLPSGCTVTGQNIGPFRLTFSGVNLPSTAAVVVTPMGSDGGRSRGVAVTQSGNQLSIAMRNDNAEVDLVDFSIAIFWAGS